MAQQTLFVRLEQGLARTVQQITTSIKADLQGLGAQIDTVERKVDETIARTNQNTM